MIDMLQRTTLMPNHPVQLPADHSRLDGEKEFHQITLLNGEKDCTGPIGAIAAELRVPESLVYLAVYFICLSSYSSQTTLSVSATSKTTNVTPLRQPDNFSMTPVVAEIVPSFTLHDFITNIQRDILGRLVEIEDGKHLGETESSLDLLADDIQNVSFSFYRGCENPFADSVEQFKNSNMEWSVEILESSESLGRMFYRSDLFEKKTVEQFCKHFVSALEYFSENAHKEIKHFSILDKKESELLIKYNNQTEIDYNRSDTVASLFVRRVEESPHSIAVRGPDDRTFTYEQLNQESNRLAHYLISLGIGHGHRVGIYLERGVDMICALMGVVKSGAAYVPLDPLFPPDRLGYMAQDAGLSLIISQSSLEQSAPVADCQQLILEKFDNSTYKSSPIDHSVADQPIYVIYTSGSTGKPKGVELRHYSVVNLVLSIAAKPGLTSEDKLLAVTTLSFDMSVLDIYLSLSVGAELIMASREQAMDPVQLASRIDSSSASVLQATPTTWKILLGSGWRGNKQLSAWTGGEPLNRDLADQLVRGCRDVWNLYGPTETTVYSLIWQVDEHTKPIPVGLPIANTEVYIVDEKTRLVAPGVIGELCIGGDGVANGYINRSELTSEKFIANPFCSNVGKVLYKTGDRARWRSDGLLEVQGRLDDQIKIRGFRIELGEIQAALLENTSVEDAVVMVREDQPDDQRLVAYLIANNSEKLNIGNLREALRERMPDYMVPSHWVQLQSYPQTPNGKVDKKKLPVPDENSTVASNVTVPQSDNEKQVAKIWADLLGINSVGSDENFTSVGGNSLKAIQLVAKLNEQLEVDISLIELFQGATVASIAEKMDTPSIVEPIDKIITPEAGNIESLSVSSPKRTEVIQSKYKTISGPCRLVSKTASGQPFFILGSNPRYSLAVDHLSDQVAVYQLDAYALQVDARTENKDAATTIESVAARFLEFVKDIQPNGPYQIGGGCEGAHIAFELAVQLQRQGEQVVQLITWHTPAPGPELKKEFGGSVLKRLWWQFQSIHSKGAGASLGLKGYRELLNHEIIEHRLFSAMFKYRASGIFEGDIDLVLLRPIDEQIPITDANDSFFNDHVNAWAELVSGNVNRTLLEGNHDTWLRKHVDVFGEYLASNLK